MTKQLLPFGIHMLYNNNVLCLRGGERQAQRYGKAWVVILKPQIPLMQLYGGAHEA